jgi:hypothetical protein
MMCTNPDENFKYVKQGLPAFCSILLDLIHGDSDNIFSETM